MTVAAPQVWTAERRDAGLCALATGLAALADRKLFCAWKLEPDADRPTKPRKVPYLGRGRKLVGSYADPTLPGRLMTLAEAAGLVRGSAEFAGVGIVFHPGCGVVGLDLDHCIDELGVLSLSASQREAVLIFKGAGAFFEASVSGTGLHAITTGEAETHRANGSIELFGDRNFLALTGANGKGKVS